MITTIKNTICLYLLVLLPVFGFQAQGQCSFNIDAGRNFSVCEKQWEQKLFGFPSGGTWTGPGIKKDYFSPDSLPPGKYKLYYQYTDTSGCTDIDSLIATIFPKPFVKAQEDIRVCRALDTLELSARPHGGFFLSPQGLIYDSSLVTDEFKFPVVEVTYLYIDNNSCHNADTFEVFLYDPPKVRIFNNDTSVCSGSDSFPIHVKPANGTWEGNAVENSYYFPGRGDTGINLVKYFISDVYNCNDTDSFNVTVVQSYRVSVLRDTGVCLGFDSIKLHALPANGKWDGKNVSPEGWFYPSRSGRGKFKLAYKLGTRACGDTDNMEVEISGVKAAFTMDGNTGYPPLTVFFNNYSRGAPTGYKWLFGNSDSSNIKNPVYVFSREGTYLIRLIATDSISGCSDTATSPLGVRVWGTSLEEEDKDIRVFPVPANDRLSLKLTNGEYAGGTAGIYSATGVLLVKKILSGNEMDFDLTGFPSGMMILEIISEDGKTQAYRKIIRQ